MASSVKGNGVLIKRMYIREHICLLASQKTNHRPLISFKHATCYSENILTCHQSQNKKLELEQLYAF